MAILPKPFDGICSSIPFCFDKNSIVSLKASAPSSVLIPAFSPGILNILPLKKETNLFNFVA